KPLDYTFIDIKMEKKDLDKKMNDLFSRIIQKIDANLALQDSDVIRDTFVFVQEMAKENSSFEVNAVSEKMAQQINELFTDILEQVYKQESDAIKALDMLRSINLQLHKLFKMNDKLPYQKLMLLFQTMNIAESSIKTFDSESAYFYLDSAKKYFNQIIFHNQPATEGNNQPAQNVNYLQMVKGALNISQDIYSKIFDVRSIYNKFSLEFNKRAGKLSPKA
ncbi:MAG: hypothetical protein PHV30_10755, partial [Candidatus Margulisbacteria bacterium]|nr:hypothetical protein [Candidatus Margulisiibacteriota bacterium]